MFSARSSGRLSAIILFGGFGMSRSRATWRDHLAPLPRRTLGFSAREVYSARLRASDAAARIGATEVNDDVVAVGADYARHGKEGKPARKRPSCVSKESVAVDEARERLGALGACVSPRWTLCDSSNSSVHSSSPRAWSGDALDAMLSPRFTDVATSPRPSTQQCLDALSRVKLFRSLSSSQLASLFSTGRMVRAPRYATLLREGQQSTTLLVLVRGRVRCSTESSVSSSPYADGWVCDASSGGSSRLLGETALVGERGVYAATCEAKAHRVHVPLHCVARSSCTLTSLVCIV
jgi:hypothetical protein